MPDRTLLCGAVCTEVGRRAESQLGVNIVALECSDQAGVAAWVGEVSLRERRVGDGGIVGIGEEVEEVFEATRLNDADELDKGIEDLESVRCVVGNSTVVSRCEDATCCDVVLASPKSVTALEAVEVLIMGRVCLLDISMQSEVLQL